jgi:raffinose/stachyose/melibiose transport system permease protein
MAIGVAEGVGAATATRPSRRRPSAYPWWFYAPAAVIFSVLFVVPTLASFYFSLTRWTLFNATFIGFGNFVQFFHDPFLVGGLVHTLIYAVLTSGAKVVLGLLLAVLLSADVFARGYLRAVVFFPVLVSTVGVGITFQALMDPSHGLVNETLTAFGLPGPGWLTNPALALYSIVIVDVWKGVGLATVIYLAGLASIDRAYFEAARIDGASEVEVFWHVTLPLMRPATVTVIILSLIGGLKSFELIWTMTQGGPGFVSDVIASLIYKEYQAGFYGLSTAGNVVLFVLVAAIMVPLSYVLNRREVQQ